MVLKHRQKLWQRILLSWPTILILLLISVLLVESLWDIYKKSNDSIARADLSKMELNKLLERKASLSKDLERIKSTDGIEAELRDKFDVAKEGEHLLVIVDKEIEIEPAKAPESWWSSVWRKLLE